MNDHLISRSRFLDALVLDADNKTDLIQVHHALEKAVISTDDVRGVGEWEHQELAPTNWTFCSVCGRHRSKKYKWYYCPNCGARMKGAEDGTTDWMARHAIVGALLCAIGFAVWIFGDVCDAQARKERKGKC